MSSLQNSPRLKLRKKELAKNKTATKEESFQRDVTATFENVRDESVLIIDEDSNRLRREKEKETILKEKENSVVYEEPVELVYERVERNMQLVNDVKNMANANQTKRFDQALKNFMNSIGVSPFYSCLQSIERFPANKKIDQQRQRQECRHFKKQKLDDVTTLHDLNCDKRGNRSREMPTHHNSPRLKQRQKRESSQRDATTPFENVRDESVLIIDEDSNRLSREKEKEAILKEKEKSVVYEEPVELVYEGVERNMQLANDNSPRLKLRQNRESFQRHDTAPFENVRDESVLIIDEDSNRLSREKEKEAILKEKEKSVVYEEPVELVYEGVERNMQLANDVKNMANAKETKRFDQALRNFMNYIANKKIDQQRQRQEILTFQKAKARRCYNSPRIKLRQKRESFQRAATAPYKYASLQRRYMFITVLENAQLSDEISFLQKK
ncbi:hypothetical protein TNCT_212651 [Trichonephila clavata]|uniref:Uncharacterized protein n=1 Tax=Trichonephila clavata TaxID=2740835 RepID=A0A8X6LRP7_TRICU|nr:hypothetical protein TNCT_212651 [Trichonephila clavata]